MSSVKSRPIEARSPRNALLCLLLLLGLTVIAPVVSLSQWRETSSNRQTIEDLYKDGSTVYAVTIGILASTDHGNSWTRLQTVGGFTHTAFTRAEDRWLLAGIYGGGRVLQAYDSSWTSWTYADSGLGSNYPTAMVTAGGKVFAGTRAGLYLSLDTGRTWTTTGSALPAGGIRALAGNETMLLAGSVRGLFGSTDLGGHWFPMDTVATHGARRPIFVSDSVILATCEDPWRVMRSTDKGLSWMRGDSGLGQWTMMALASSGSTIFAATGGGVYKSTNLGRSWTYISEGLTNPFVTAITVSGGNLIAGTFEGSGTAPYYGGLWVRPLSEVTAVSSTGEGRPLAARLDQNYPNPFNPATSIRYALGQRSHVAFSVFNALGQHVAELVNSDLEAGEHVVEFHGQNLASGLYFYRIRAGAYTATRTMLMVR